MSQENDLVGASYQIYQHAETKDPQRRLLTPHGSAYARENRRAANLLRLATQATANTL